eukprot:scaffold69583_cov29-Phaeocystis_antarctica.AAC.1
MPYAARQLCSHIVAQSHGHSHTVTSHTVTHSAAQSHHQSITFHGRTLAHCYKEVVVDNRPHLDDWRAPPPMTRAAPAKRSSTTKTTNPPMAQQMPKHPRMNPRVGGCGEVGGGLGEGGGGG